MSVELLTRIRERSARVVVVGQGYVGLPLAMAAVDAGFSVVGLESSPERVALLKAGSSYIGDVGHETLRSALSGGYLPTSEVDLCEGFDVAVISVPTPLKGGVPDLSFVERAADDLGRIAQPGSCVILESTTFPGTTEELVLPILLSRSGLTSDSVYLGYSPERIDPGNISYSFESTPKIVSGINRKSLLVVEEFFKSMGVKTVAVETCKEAEMAKLLENTFRHVNIALINELARFAHQLDVNIWNVIDAAGTKPFGFMRFSPGPGVGGHCLPVDPSYLAWNVNEKLGETFRFIELANDINDHMPEYVIGRIESLLRGSGRSLSNSKILVLGLAYKQDTSDWRESPSIALVDGLEVKGASVSVCDPLVMPSLTGEVGRLMVDFSAAELRSADLVVMMVGHAAFAKDLIARESKLVFDARNILQGFEFRGEHL